MCDLVYLIVIGIILIICFFLIKKSKIVNKRRWFIISMVIVYLLYFFFGGLSVGEAISMILFVIIFIICLFVIKKIKIKKAKRIDEVSWYAQSFAIACVSFLLLCFVPFEDAFLTFSSPESAFRYSNSSPESIFPYSNSGDVIFVMEGGESALVLGINSDNEAVFNLIRRSGTEWKLTGSLGDYKRTVSGISPNYICFTIRQYRDSKDYYVTVYDSNSCAVNVADNCNSRFYHLMKTSDSSGETYHTYYAYVHDLDDDYTLIVNGEVIQVFYVQY
jgi:Ca2+/Na+ antiporter